MIEWLTDAIVFERVYWYLAIPFTVLLAIQLVMSFLGLGGDDEGDFDADGDGDGDSGFRIFTIKNFVTFFAIFGWSGITFSNAGVGEGLTVVLSVIIGVIVLLIISGLFYSITKLTSSGTMNIQHAKGLTGEVYLPIPANRSGMGKVNITLQGSLREMNAVTDENKRIPRGAVVEVTDIISNSILLVEKVQKGDK